jgi:CubicO group peptidase (beta-lactamase class C family)
VNLARLIESSVLPNDSPMVLAACGPSGVATTAAAGCWPDGRPVGVDDFFYVASLAKQVTGAAAAVLVRQGRLEPDRPVSRYLPGLPDWAQRVTSRHLLNHTSGLPGAGSEPAGVDWTREVALGQLGQAVLNAEPGAVQAYSNLGYVLLAEVIAAVVSAPFAQWVEEEVLAPLGLAGMRFAEGGVEQFEQAPALGPARPLTVGDGGLWATAPAFCRWLHLQNVDALGISDLVTAPAGLSGGGVGDYGWGIGLREREGRRLFIHGGQWGRVVAKAVRSPATGTAACAMASDLPIEDLSAVVDRALAMAETPAS